MTDETNVNPGPADKGGPTSEPGAHDTNAGASSEGNAEGVTLEAVAKQLADLGSRLEGIDGRTRRQVDELRRNLPKSEAEPQPKSEAASSGKPDSEIATLRKQIEAFQQQANEERKRAAIADVFAAEEVRSVYADGALDIVRKLLSADAVLNSEGVPVIDNGETQTPLSEVVKAYAKDKPFLRRPTNAKGTGAPPSQSSNTRVQAGEIDWMKASPEQLKARQREILGGDR